MIEINKFYLWWDTVWNCQIITWWDKIYINIILNKQKNVNIYKSYIDVSSYSNKKIIFFNFKNIWNNKYFFDLTLDVDFLWMNGIEVWLNNKKSAIKLTIETNIGNLYFYSNPIWNADYFSFSEKDHHLWVYTKWIELNNNKLKEISKNDDFFNDIIFINRYIWNKYFLDINLDFSSLLIEIIKRINNKDKFIIINNNLDYLYNISDIEKVIKKIIVLNKYIKIYYYNFPFCVFKDCWEKVIKENVLYNSIFPIELGFSMFWKCEGCKYKNICNNINIKYWEKYWILEFKPFKT